MDFFFWATVAKSTQRSQGKSPFAQTQLLAYVSERSIHACPLCSQPLPSLLVVRKKLLVDNNWS